MSKWRDFPAWTGDEPDTETGMDLETETRIDTRAVEYHRRLGVTDVLYPDQFNDVLGSAFDRLQDLAERVDQQEQRLPAYDLPDGGDDEDNPESHRLPVKRPAPLGTYNEVRELARKIIAVGAELRDAINATETNERRPMPVQWLWYRSKYSCTALQRRGEHLLYVSVVWESFCVGWAEGERAYRLQYWIGNLQKTFHDCAAEGYMSVEVMRSLGHAIDGVVGAAEVNHA